MIALDGDDGDGGDGSGSEHGWGGEYDEDDVDSETVSSDDFLDDYTRPGRHSGPMTYTALHIAVYRGATTIIEALLSHGADINMTSNNYCSCDGSLESNLQSWYRRKMQERIHEPMWYITPWQ